MLEVDHVEVKQKTIEAVGKSMYTFIVFVGFIFLIPVIIFICFYVQIYRLVWFGFLARTYPHLEIVKRLSIRSAMDTYRTQGLLTILLQICGQCDVDLVKKKIQEDVIEKLNANGTLRFPHMKNNITSCWGRYAWVKDNSHFNINNHVQYVKNPLLRNRPVTSANIQEYVSEAITRFLPPWKKEPAWQIMIITTESDRCYILARVHHLYLVEDNISFGHLLMIDPEDEWLQTKPHQIDSIENILQQISQKPIVFPLIYTHLHKLIMDLWNEFRTTYNGSLENPSSSADCPYNILQLFTGFFKTAFAVLQQYVKTRQNLPTICYEEMKKRHIDLQSLIHSTTSVALYPLHVTKITIAWFLWLYMRCLVYIPVVLSHIVFNLPVYLSWISMLARAVGEVGCILHLAYTTPRIILDELILPMFQLPRHHLQKVSLSGRKVVSWTKSIPIELIRRISDRTGVASCEIQLYGLAAALHGYFQKYKLEETTEILTTTRFIPQEHLLKSANEISTGLLCLPLPMNLPDDDALYGLHLMQLALQDAITDQTAMYLTSLWQCDYDFMTTIFPSILVRILLYVLSTRYSVMLTQVEAHTKEMKKRRLVWGQEVESFIYWRQPQANVSLSATLINYGDEMRFALMADAELAPQYSIIVSQYEYYIKQLAEEADIYSTSKLG